MVSINLKLLKLIGSVVIYSLGLALLLFWGEYYLYLVLGYSLSLLSYFYLIYYLKENYLNNVRIYSPQNGVAWKIER